VATLGAAGALVCEGVAVERVAGVAAQCVDTTGAGDAFNGALAVGLGAGVTLIDAVALANAAAAASTERLGAQDGLLTELELRRRLHA
jgi:ribokinase